MSIAQGIATGLRESITSIPERLTEKAKAAWEGANEQINEKKDIARDVVNDPKVQEATRDDGKRRLTGEERELAEEYFGDSIDLDKVRVNNSSALVPANRHLPENEREDGSKPENGRPFVLGNTINFSRELDLSDPDDAALFVHELTHVWQFQSTLGIQTTIEGINQPSYDLVKKDDDGNLILDDKGKPDASQLETASSIQEFNIEQQGEITRGHFLLSRHEELTGLLEGPRSPEERGAIQAELKDIENNSLYDELRSAGVTSGDLDRYITEIKDTSPREGVIAEGDEAAYEIVDAGGEGIDESLREGLEAGEEITEELQEGDVIGASGEVLEGAAEVGREVVEGTFDTTGEIVEGTFEVGREGVKKIFGWP